MKVSIVIPSYNHEKFIAEAIQSILNQTFQDFEIIITDDGSSDNTVEEIEKFTDTRIKLFKFSKNKGAYFAVENCLKYATGEYIAVLSSDDFFLPSKLEKQVKFLDDNDKYAAVFTQAKIIDEEGNDFTDNDHFYHSIFDQENRTRHEWLYKLFYEGNFFCHPSILIRKEYYKIKYFDPRYRQIPDYDFWIKLCMKAEVYILQEKLLAFRILDNEDNTSGNKADKNIRSGYELLNVLKNYLSLSVEDYIQIFSQDTTINSNVSDEYSVPYLIAQKALEVNNPAYRMFGLNALYELMHDEKVALQLQKKYGFSNNDLFDIAGKFDIFNLYPSWTYSLYIDSGNGVNEDEKIISKVEPSNQKDFKINVDLSQYHNIKSLRFDPIEDKRSKIKIDHIYYTLENAKTVDISSSLTSNSQIKKDDYHIFETLDPWFILPVPMEKKIKSITIIGSWIIDEYTNLYLDFNNMIIKVQNKEQHIAALNKTIEDKEIYIQHWHDVAQSMRIKNRMKRFLKKIVPQKLWKILKYIKHNPQAINKSVNVLKNNGIKELLNKIDSLNETQIINGYIYHEPVLDVNIKQEITSFIEKPLISIIMPVYNVDPKWLDLAIQSVENQWYENWELCIADDKSTNKDTIKYLKNIKNSKIKIKYLERNVNISTASNKASKLANGEYIVLLDNDDELTPDALYEIIKVINQHNPDFIYSDEDKLELDGSHTFPFFKPDFSYDLLLSLNYITHLATIKKELFDKISGFNIGVEGAQDHDLFLRIIEQTDKIVHIPKVLYHWRMLETSTAKTSDAKPYAHNAAKKAIQDHLNRIGTRATVIDSEYTFVLDINYDLPEPQPLVSIIIPTKDGINFLDVCIKSILEISTYTNYEIIILNNNSTENETFEWFKKMQQLHSNIKVIEANYKFNWSKLNNHGIKEANGDVYIFLNNDIKIISNDWIERLVSRALQPSVGTVGALLLFEDDTIQHAGVVVGMNGWADHVYRETRQVHMHSPYVSPMVTRNVLASTGACLAISKNTIDAIGKFDEDFLICGSDVEISLRAYERGYRNIFDANSKLYHYESKTRDSFVPECDFDMSRKAYQLYWKNGDPFYNHNLKLDSVIPTYKGQA